MDLLVVPIIIITATLHGASLNLVEMTGYPWGVETQEIVVHRGFNLSYNYPLKDEYYISSQYRSRPCQKENFFPKGTIIKVLDVDYIYRFPDLSLTYKLLYKTEINGQEYNIITQRNVDEDRSELMKGLRLEIDKSLCE